MTGRLSWFSLVSGAFLCLFVCYGLATRAIFVGSGEGHWVYPFFWPFSSSVLVMWACACAIALPLVAISPAMLDDHEWLIVGTWVLAGLAMQALLRSLTDFTFEQMFASDTANSFYSPTGQYGAAAILSGFDRIRGSLPLHAQSNMPGKLVFVSLLRYLSDHPASMAWLVVILSNLGGVLLYFFVKALFDQRTGLVALILYLVVPGKLYFFPLLNVVTPLLIAAMALLMQKWVTSRRPVYPALAGVLLYLLVLFEPLPLIMGLLFLAIIAAGLRSRPASAGTIAKHTAVGVAAFIVTYVFFRAAFHFDLVSTFRRTQQAAAAFNATADRPYGVWLRANLLEFAIAVGVCQAVMFCWVLVVGVVRATTGGAKFDDRLVAVTVGLAATLLVMDLLGVNRGEVTRLWIFLACFFQIPAAYVCAQLNNRAALAIVLACTLLQGAIGAGTIGFVLP